MTVAIKAKEVKFTPQHKLFNVLSITGGHMKIWLIEANSSSGTSYKETAYSDKKTCELKCEGLEEEWVSYKPVGEVGEPISENRIIVDRMVFDLDKTESMEEIKNGP